MKILYELEEGESFSELRCAEAISKSLDIEKITRVVDYLMLMIKHDTCKRFLDDDMKRVMVLLDEAGLLEKEE